MPDMLFEEPMTERERVILAELQAVHSKYPYDTACDLTMVRLLQDEYPRVDLVDEIRQWRLWILDNPPKGKWNWRSRFRKWVQNSERYRTERLAGGRGGRFNAATPKDFGSTSVVEKW